MSNENTKDEIDIKQDDEKKNTPIYIKTDNKQTSVDILNNQTVDGCIPTQSKPDISENSNIYLQDTEAEMARRARKIAKSSKKWNRRLWLLTCCFGYKRNKVSSCQDLFFS